MYTHNIKKRRECERVNARNPAAPPPFLFGVEIDGDDQSVQTQDLGEDENQDHSDEEPRLLRRSSDSCVAYNSDCVACGETRETDGEAGSEMDEAPGNINKTALSDVQGDLLRFLLTCTACR